MSLLHIDMTQVLKSLLKQDQEHGRWHRQGISSHDIDLVKPQ